MDGGSNGMLSSDCAVNPHFCNATKAHMNCARVVFLCMSVAPHALTPLRPHPDCDGGSFANSLDAPLSDGNGGLLYFRGALIFNETITRLLALGMSDAREIILKGCSAGGLATFIHASFFHAWMKTAAPNARVVSMPDAGFFRDHPDINGNPYYTPQQQWVFATQNVTQVDPGCLAFYGGRSSPDAWRCFFAEYVLPHITVPLFITQDTVDSWQLPNIFRLPCEPYKSGSCNASQLAAVADYRTSMLAALGTANGGGGYFSSCIQHCHQNINAVWTQELVANTTVRDAFFSWWSGADTLPRIIVDGPWGTNAHCFGVPYHCE